MHTNTQVQDFIDRISGASSFYGLRSETLNSMVLSLVSPLTTSYESLKEPSVNTESLNMCSVTAQPPKEPTVTVPPPKEPIVTVQPSKKPTVTVQLPKEPTVTVQPPKEPTVTVQPPKEPTVTVQPPKEPTVTDLKVLLMEKLLQSLKRYFHILPVSTTRLRAFFTSDDNLPSSPAVFCWRAAPGHEVCV